MRYLVTGGAGFIGSHLADALIKRGQVRAYDNLSNGKREFLAHLEGKEGFEFVQADIHEPEKLLAAMKGVDFVFHLAANPDIRFGTANTDIDLKQGTLSTYYVLDAMRKAGVKNIAFSSSQTVYGDPTVAKVPESYGPMVPISLYGAAKLAAEGLVTAYAHTFETRAWIFRFANVIGPRSNHGVIPDFVAKLRKDSKALEILGDGTQSKSYLLVEDVVEAMLFAVDRSRDPVTILNFGTDDWVSVARIGGIVVEECNLKDVKFNFTGGKRGWKGDVPRIMLDTSKMSALGWKPRHSSEDAVRAVSRALATASSAPPTNQAR
jgi:UDP-glucose 4-epimerase